MSGAPADRSLRQEQFLTVIDERTARARFDAACAGLAPRSERLPLAALLGRVLAADVSATVDVPGFDRSDVDGFAVRAEDTFGAEELAPRTLRVSSLRLPAGRAAPAAFALAPGEAVSIATGGMVPRGADAVVMVEHARVEDDGTLSVLHSVLPGAHVTFAGSDLARGEIVLRRGTHLTSRHTGILAAIGASGADVFARPVVAVLSTGDEVRAPGTPAGPADVYDSNQRVLADAVRECGGDARELGIVPDDEEALARVLSTVVGGASVHSTGPAAESGSIPSDESRRPDVVLLSGGTSKGAGDLNYRVVERLAAAIPGSPGIVVHGVALKPGKPLCLAVLGRTPVVVLPGFPTSAVFTFHEFVAPLLRRLGGRPEEAADGVTAVLPRRLASAIGRTDYQLVQLVPGPDGPIAYPLGGGSGSVSAFARADGFLRVAQDTESLDAGETVAVRSLGRAPRAADLVVVGSHCLALDRLLSAVAARGFTVTAVAVGSQGGLTALARGEGDVAGVHLLDPATGVYNTPFLPADPERPLRVVRGWRRRQGLVFRRGDARFEGVPPDAFAARALLPGVRMVNRNRGSGTRVLLDLLLGGLPAGRVPDGHAHQARSHHAVAAAVAQGRADWGMTLDVLAREHGLSFTFVRDEEFDLVVRADRFEAPGVRALREVLASGEGEAILRGLGFVPTGNR